MRAEMLCGPLPPYLSRCLVLHSLFCFIATLFFHKHADRTLSNSIALKDHRALDRDRELIRGMHNFKLAARRQQRFKIMSMCGGMAKLGAQFDA